MTVCASIGVGLALEAELAEAELLADALEIEIAFGANEIIDGDGHLVAGQCQISADGNDGTHSTISK